MRIDSITIHNFRSIEDGTFNLGNYSLLIGANNSGKSNVIDALRVFFEKGIKYEEELDFPKFDTSDNESWIEIELILDKEEYDNLEGKYKILDNRIIVRKYLKT